MQVRTRKFVEKLSFKSMFLKNLIVSIITSVIPIYVAYKHSPTKETVVKTVKSLIVDELTQIILICFVATYFITLFLKQYIWIQNKYIKKRLLFCYLIIKDLNSLFKSVLLSFSGICILLATLWPIFEPNTFSIKGMFIVLLISCLYLLFATLIDNYDENIR